MSTGLGISRFRAIVISLFFTIGMVASPAIAADPAALDFPNLGGGSDFSQGTYSLGWKFATRRAVSVSALGFYDDLKNGLTEAHQVGIFDSNCQVLASTTVLPSDPLIGFFRYHDITPITLAAESQFFIAAVTGSEKYAINVGTLNVHNDISFGGFTIFGETQSTTTLECPNGTNDPEFNGDFGPSFLIGTVGAGGPPPTPALRDSAVSVACNRGPNPADDYLCTATVGAADAQGPNPTGAVVWGLTDNRGAFRFGNKCSLSASPAPSFTSTCSVIYLQPAGGIPLGTPVPISAAYSGDAAYKPSSNTQVIPGAVIPPTSKPNICLSPNPLECGGLNVEVPPEISPATGFGNLNVSYFGLFGVSQQAVKAVPRLLAPRRRGDISFRVRYAIFRADNPLISQIQGLPRGARNSSVAIGSVGGGLRFGQSRDVRVPLTTPGRQLIAALGPSRIGNVNIRVAVDAIRQGDRRPTTLVGIINVGVR